MIPSDLRIALRSLRRVPVLTLSILATVGLGIGATTAIYAAVDAALLRPLPYRDPGKLVAIYTDAPPFVFRFSAVDYLALEEQQTAFERIAAYTDRSLAFSSAGSDAALLRGREVTWTYFGVLGVTPAVGRDFTPEDGTVGAAPAAIVSDRFWRDRLGGRAEVVGSLLELEGATYTVRGVLPAATGPLEQAQDVFVAARFTPPRRRGPFPYLVIGRLKPDVEPAAARMQLHDINRRLFPIWRASYQDERATWSLVDLKTRLTGNSTTTAGLALAGVVLLWLIACANASHLLTARVVSRRRELAVRGALGASRGRIITLLLVESAVLAIGAALLGVVVADLGIAAIRATGTTYIPRTSEISLAGSALVVLLATTILSALMFGLVPAVAGARSGPAALGVGDRGATVGTGVRRLRRVLVGSQLAIATPLLVLSLLLLGSLAALQRVDLGFDTAHVVSAALRLPASQYADPGARTAWWDALEARLASVPGVDAVAFTDSRPPATAPNENNFDLEDAPTPAGASQPTSPFVAVTPGYFDVMGLRPLEGRLIEPRDAEAENLLSVVVDRAWVRRFFPDGHAVGRRFREGGCTACPWTTVVGVVDDVRFSGLDQVSRGTVYTAMEPTLSRFVLVRTSTDPAGVVPQVRQVVRGLNPAVPLTAVAAGEALTADALARPRALSLLVTAIAGVALVLAVVGLYGVMAHHVQQRQRDIGVRLALGASRRRVLGSIVGEGLTVTVAGIAFGLAVAIVAARSVASLLYGVTATSGAAYAVAGAVLLVAALVTCAIPARRIVARPLVALLRQE